jgi:hypothetical protein
MQKHGGVDLLGGGKRLSFVENARQGIETDFENRDGGGRQR